MSQGSSYFPPQPSLEYMVQAIAPFPNIAGVFKNLALRVAQLLSSFLSFEDQYHQNLCRFDIFFRVRKLKCEKDL